MDKCAFLSASLTSHVLSTVSSFTSQIDPPRNQIQYVFLPLPSSDLTVQVLETCIVAKLDGTEG